MTKIVAKLMKEIKKGNASASAKKDVLEPVLQKCGLAESLLAPIDPIKHIMLKHDLRDMETEQKNKTKRHSAGGKKSAKTRQKQAAEIKKIVIEMLDGKTQCSEEDAVRISARLLKEHGIRRGWKTIYQWF